jgi:phosphoserine aminotransferase
MKPPKQATPLRDQKRTPTPQQTPEQNQRRTNSARFALEGTMRLLNFGAGPATLPEEVLQQAQAEMLDWQGSGMSVMEMSHRGVEFEGMLAQAQADLRELLGVPEHYAVMFMQGGAIAQNSLVPLNLIGSKDSADFVLTGAWSVKSQAEASRYLRARVVASSESSGFDHIPDEADWQLDPNAAYLQICGNETIGGLQFHREPQSLPGVPLVADLSSEIMSRPVEVDKYGLIYAGAQKNLGVAGVTIVIVDEALFGRTSAGCPSIFNYESVAGADSMLNTPPTYAIYISGLVLQWLKRQATAGQSALEVIQQRNAAKAGDLYAAIDSSDFYSNSVRTSDRSVMNVPFRLADDKLNQPFLDQAKAAGMLQLKGHKSVGGMRASIYNAMPHAGVTRLIEFMQDFEKRMA